MKKMLIALVVMSIALFMTACGDNDNNATENDTSDNNVSENESDNNNANTNADNNENTNTNNEDADNENDANEDAESTDDMEAKMEKLPYNEIELEVDYGKDNEYEIEIEQDEGEAIEAEIEDELNDVYLTGVEAFNELYPKVKALSIDQDTNKDDAINDALKTFDLDDDYDEFEIEITFSDGKELEYEDK